jgi:hypothetical protein
MKKTFFLLALILPVCTVIAQLPEPDIPLPGNLALVDQDGMFNHATVTQDGDYNLSTVNTFGVFNAESSVDQTGSMNNSTVNQLGWGNTVDVTQMNGEGNTSDDNLNFSWIAQFGMNNEAEVIQQHAEYTPNPNAQGTLDAFVLQTGFNNSATQYQTGIRDLAIAVQTGSNGTAVQKQGNSDFMDGNSYSALAVIVQLPTADNSAAHQHQVGQWNVAGVLQGADDGIAKQEQLSDKSTNPHNIPFDLPNVAGIVQSEGVWFDSGNEAYQIQYYDGVSTYGNWAGALQVGGGNISTQIQHGGNNLSGVSQHGLGNEAYVSQTNGNDPAAGRMTMDVPWD